MKPNVQEMTNEQLANKVISIMGNKAPPRNKLLFALKDPVMKAKLFEIIKDPKFIVGIDGRKYIS